jgi:spore coat polysaccharide biosynthesis protein SpsF
VDTARAYGISEERLGRTLGQGLGERLRIVTKLRPLDGIPEDAPPDWVRAAIKASVAESLRSLRTPQVDALLVHRWADWGKGNGTTAEALMEYQMAGTARLLGASVGNPGELVEALADARIEYIQFPFNLLDRRWLADIVVDALQARPEVVVSARSVFLQGLLVGWPHVEWPSSPAVDANALMTQLLKLRDELERESMADLCLAYVLGHDFVTSVVVGAETAEQVCEQAQLIRRPPLSGEEIRHVHDRVGCASDELLDPSRWSRANGR